MIKLEETKSVLVYKIESYKPLDDFLEAFEECIRDAEKSHLISGFMYDAKTFKLKFEVIGKTELGVTKK